MDTSLKLFSEAFDVTPEEMYILMLSDKEFFKEPLKIKMNYGEMGAHICGNPVKPRVDG